MAEILVTLPLMQSSYANTVYRNETGVQWSEKKGFTYDGVKGKLIDSIPLTYESTMSKDELNMEIVKHAPFAVTSKLSSDRLSITYTLHCKD